MPASWSIRHYLILLVLAMAIPMVALLYYSMRLNYEASLQQAEQSIRRQAELAAADTARMIRGAEDFLTGLAARPQVAALDYNRCDPILSDVKKLFPHYAVVGVLDYNGLMLCASGRPSGTKLPNFGNFEWFRDAQRKNDFHISAIHVGKVSDKWVTTFSAPIRDTQGTFKGLVGYSFDLASNPLLLSSQGNLRSGESITLVDQKGRVVMRSATSREIIGEKHSLFNQLHEIDSPEEKGFLARDDDQPYLMAYVPIEETPWSALAHIPAAEVLSNLWLRANQQYLIAVALTLIGTALAVWIAKHIVRPIQSIAFTAARVAKGEADDRIPGKGPRELVHVASQINQMLDIRLRAEKQYQDLFESASDGIVVVRRDGNIMLTNRRACEIFGYDNGDLDGEPIEVLVPKRSRTEHKDFFKSYFEQPERRDLGRMVSGLCKNGSEIPCDISLSPFDTHDETIVAAFVRDLSKWTQMESELAYLARHDQLTELPNRTLLADRLSQAVARANRDSSGIAVVHVDLDHFAHINDFYGMEQADKVLKQVANLLQQSVREFETVVRSGSDEFVVLLESPQIEVLAEQFIERIRNGLNILSTDQTTIKVTASYGVALYPCEGGAGELLKNADLALAEARQSGGDTFRFFDRNMDMAARRRVELISQLHGVLEREELSLVYQPQVETRTGHIYGVEALLRWNNPTLGAVSPAEFIPLIEASGQIDSIGAWVLQTACHQTAEWHTQHQLSLNVSVNLSTRQFRNRTQLLDVVRIALKESQLPPQYLELEITESMLMDSPQMAVETLHALRALGVRISIDDFGTGYSSLSYLRRFPVHTLKVDQSFVQDLVHQRDDREIISAIISLAHSLQLDVVAEGVETESQRDFLEQQGCRLCQGYLFSRPLTPEAIPALLKAPQDDPEQG